MAQVLLCLLAYGLLALWEVPRLLREQRGRELRAFWTLLLLSLPVALWRSAGGPVPPLNQAIAAALRPLGRALTGLLE